MGDSLSREATSWLNPTRETENCMDRQDERILYPGADRRIPEATFALCGDGSLAAQRRSCAVKAVPRRLALRTKRSRAAGFLREAVFFGGARKIHRRSPRWQSPASIVRGRPGERIQPASATLGDHGFVAGQNDDSSRTGESSSLGTTLPGGHYSEGPSLSPRTLKHFRNSAVYLRDVSEFADSF